MSDRDRVTAILTLAEAARAQGTWADVDWDPEWAYRRLLKALDTIDSLEGENAKLRERLSTWAGPQRSDAAVVKYDSPRLGKGVLVTSNPVLAARDGTVTIERLNGGNESGDGMSKLEQELLNRILYIGDEIPSAVASDPRPKFVLLGSPKELIDALDGNRLGDRPIEPHQRPEVE